MIRATSGTPLIERRRPSFGRIEIMAVHDRAQHETHQRDPAGDQIAQRLVAGLLPQLAGVQPGGLDRDERLRHELLIVGERALGRLHPSCVAVEREDDLA